MNILPCLHQLVFPYMMLHTIVNQIPARCESLSTAGLAYMQCLCGNVTKNAGSLSCLSVQEDLLLLHSRFLNNSKGIILGELLFNLRVFGHTSMLLK